MTPEEKADPKPLPTTFILFKEGKFAKFYLILTGHLVEYDYNVLINKYLKKEKAAPKTSTAPPTIQPSDPNPERIQPGHRKITMQQGPPPTAPPTATVPIPAPS